MLAVVCRECCGIPGLALESVAAPEAGRGEVVIDVHACGVNFADGLMIQGRYQARPSLPFVPGIEASGVVSQVGADVSDLTPGARVMAYTGIGGLAERVKVARAQVSLIPEGMDYVTAVAFLVSHGTSYHGLRDRARLQTGETLLVLGAAGGVGLAAVEIGKAMGARVIAAASNPDKLALCKEYGADEIVDYTRVDWRKYARDITGGGGFDVVYDPVGGPHAEALVRCLTFGGRYLVIGFANGTVPAVPLNLLLLKVASISGVFWGAFAERFPDRNARNVAELSALYAQRKIRPHVSARYPLPEFASALGDVLGRRARGKVVVEIRAT
jgi:NADPH:quinone reductase